MGHVLDCVPVNLGTAELSAQLLKIKKLLEGSKNKFSVTFQFFSFLSKVFFFPLNWLFACWLVLMVTLF